MYWHMLFFCVNNSCFIVQTFVGLISIPIRPFIEVNVKVVDWASAKLCSCLHVLNSNTLTLRPCSLKPVLLAAVCPFAPLWARLFAARNQDWYKRCWNRCGNAYFPLPQREKITNQARKKQTKKYFLAGDHLHSSCVNGSKTASVSVPLSEQQCVPSEGKLSRCWPRAIGRGFLFVHHPALLAKPCPCVGMPSVITIDKGWCISFFYFLTVLLR